MTKFDLAIRGTNIVLTNVSENIVSKYTKFINKKSHKYGDLILRISPTGIGNAITLIHEDTKDAIDLTNYSTW